MRLFTISYTQKNGVEIRGQLYTADTVSNKLVALVQEDASNIEVHEYRTGGSDDN